MLRSSQGIEETGEGNGEERQRGVEEKVFSLAREQESSYNLGRALQHLGLNDVAVKYYK